MRTKFIVPILLGITLLAFGYVFVMPSESSNNNSFNGYKDRTMVSPIDAAKGISTTGNNKIMYWIQLSDVHINLDLAQNIENLKNFSNKTLPVVHPSFVTVSGDMVDGGTPDTQKQRHPIEAEYALFNEIIANYAPSSIPWHFAIGNHEQYDTINPSPYFTYFSNESNYVYNITTPFGIYRFVVIDTTQRGGMTNFFNLWGEMDTEKLDLIEKLLQTDSPNQFNHTFVIGHHPINQLFSQKSSSGNNFKEILLNANVTAYLNGHVHQENFYRIIDNELIEIMLPEFEDKHFYRICAIDNDRFSFSDQIINQWPAAVITNPIDGRFATKAQNLAQTEKDGEIRVLIFDPNPILKTTVSIDGEEIGSLQFVGDNIWSIAYNPALYQKGIHTLKIMIESESGTLEKVQQFQLSEPYGIPIRGLGNVIISFPIKGVLIGAIVLFQLIAVASIFLPRLWEKFFHQTYTKYVSFKPELFNTFLSRHYFKPWVQAADLPLSFAITLIIIPAYVLIGPLVIGEFITGHFGVMLLYGVFIRGFRVLTFQTLIFTNLYLISALALQYFCIRAWKNHNIRLLWLEMLFILGPPVGLTIMVGTYFGPIAGIFSPIHILIYLVTILSIRQLNLKKK